MQENHGQFPYACTYQATETSSAYPVGIYMLGQGIADFSDALSTNASAPSFNQSGTLLPYLANGSTSVAARQAIFNCPTDAADGDVT